MNPTTRTDRPSQPAEKASPLPIALDGSKSIAELTERHSASALTVLGKQTIADAGARLAQIQGLKPGSSSIRTPELIEAILVRLLRGESLTSITCDPDMPAINTLWTWTRVDQWLDDEIKWAQAMGQRVLKDLQQDIASGGIFSTGDARRDELLIKVIEKNASQRNRAEFGDRVQVDHASVTINLPDRTSDL